MNVNLSPRFKRSYKRIPRHIQSDFDKKISIFIRTPDHPSLKTHKLKGKLQECLAFRLKDGHRVLFEFSGPDTVDLLDVGRMIFINDFGDKREKSMQTSHTPEH